MKFRKLNSAEDIIKLTEEIGFLPFFANGIEGFSVEENCPRELWFSGETDGPWEWKGPIARDGRCVYGKFFAGKAGFVSREWFPVLANYRRSGYDFDARWDDGLVSKKGKDVYDLICRNGAIISKEIKRALNYRKDGNTGFETVITRLQMQTYVNTADFVYMRDKHGGVYGWGVAEYTTPEAMFGADFVTRDYSRDPADSRELIRQHLEKVLGCPDEKLLGKLIK